MCFSAHMTADARKGQRLWAALELKLQSIVSRPGWVLGIEFWS